MITGASSGIGEATALHLASLGGRCLILGGRDVDRLETVASTCRSHGCRVATVQGDLATRPGLAAVKAAMTREAKIDVLVNAAGWGAFAPPAKLNPETFHKILQVNLSAAFELCCHAAGLMQSGGTIVNVSSDADYVGFPGASAYCASKGGLLMMSRALREDLRPAGIRVCVVSPGRVDTRFNGKTPGMRPGALRADEVAEAIVFAICCSSNIDIQELRLDSMSRLSAS
nr:MULTISPECIES: SDR family oxidoreductase [unclassified Mesorhizobium]